MINQQIALAAVNNMHLDALGLASGQLAAKWASESVTFDETTLRLTTTGRWHAIANGTIHWYPSGTGDLTDATGATLTGATAVLRIHPQSYLRLARLYAKRFENRDDGRSTRPVPWAIAFHEPQLPADLRTHTDASDPPAKPELAHVGLDLHDGDDWSLGGSMSFHDARGLIIDPVAVACAVKDLLATYGMLLAHDGRASDVTSATDLTTVGGIASLATGRRVHFVDLHGGTFTGTGLTVGTTAPSGGNAEWPDAQTISSSTTTHRWGFATNGRLDATALSPPALPSGVTLTRDFFRVAVVDLSTHLLGHRGDTAVDGLGAVDEHTRAEPAPEVRDSESLDLYVEGQAVLGAMQTARSDRTTYAVAPLVMTDFELPPSATDQWPAYPPPSGTAEAWNTETAGQIRTQWTASFIGTTVDVSLTLGAGIAPRGAHVRVFPRVFVEGPALAESPSVLRGDGAATIAGDGVLHLVLRNPLKVPDGRQPTNAKLRFDVVVVPRPTGERPRARLIGGLVAEIATTDGTDDTPAAATRTLADVPASQRGEARAPILGIPAAAPASGDLARLLQALSEAEPREAPRFPTMMRNDAILAAHGTSGGWESVLTNGWIAPRSRRAQVRFGNPGNPAGPEERVVGVRTHDGRLAYDLARAALRRTRHLIPRLGDLTSSSFDLPSAPTTGTFAAAVLQTIAPRCENPELSAYPDPASLPDDWRGLVTTLGSVLPALSGIAGGSPPSGSADRLIAEVKREAMAAKQGRRDAQWALRWHIAHARHLIYIESMLFAPTADGTAAHEWNLVEALRQRLTDSPNLRVVLSLPAEVPFGAGYEGWGKYFYNARKAAVDRLKAVAADRVVAFHPVGFPGRPEIHRGSVVIVDDVWAMVGTSTLSTRGLTFDGGLDLSLLDRELRDGVSLKIRDLRRRLMARTLGKQAAAAGETPDPGWVRLARMRAAFDLFVEVLGHNGEGVIRPLYDGPEDVLPQSATIADPDGRDFDTGLLAGATWAAALATLGADRV